MFDNLLCILVLLIRALIFNFYDILCAFFFSPYENAQEKAYQPGSKYCVRKSDFFYEDTAYIMVCSILAELVTKYV